MAIKHSLFDKRIPIDSIDLELENGKTTPIDVLRLDQIHPAISGNKWYKLKYNLIEAKKEQATAILSFGGAFSNHLHALAFAGHLFKVKTIGIVRGEEIKNPTLLDCKNWGMELHFISREDYRKKTEPYFLTNLEKKHPNTYIIPEGGDNALGQKGCAEILTEEVIEKYDVLCCAIGTGTTLTGIASAFTKSIWGFAPFKNAYSLRQKLCSSIPNLRYVDNYHFGGFGKIKPELEDYIKSFNANYGIELDRVYTAKMFYGLREELCLADSSIKKILVVHTGGLQGNRSLH